MKKIFFSSFGAAFTIIGSVIGAGFITGKEISVFFCKDFSVSGLYASFVFFFLFIFALSVSRGGVVEKIVGYAVALTGIIIASCMTAALNSLFKSIFRETENFKIFTIITVFFAVIVCIKGVGAMNAVSMAVMPFVLVFIVVLSLVSAGDLSVKISPQGKDGLVFPLLYVGINCLLSSKVIVDSTKGLTMRKKLVCAFFVSFSLCLCIFFIGVRVCGKEGEMPFLSALGDNVICLKIAVVITFFSIFTTLVASVYSAFTLAKGKTSVLQKIIITLVFLMFSRFGFSEFVEKVYPVLGVIGVIYFVSVSSEIFLTRRRARTLLRQECRVLPSKP